MFIAGDLERDQALIENVLTVMEAARVAQCSSEMPDGPALRFGTLDFSGPPRPRTMAEGLS